MQKGSVNKVILVGRLGQKPEIKYAPSGTAIVNLSMATNEVSRGRDGGNVETTEWHKVVLFGKTAEFVGNYIDKGGLLYIEGRNQTRSWEDKDGVRHYVTEVIGHIATPLGDRSRDEGSGGERSDGFDGKVADEDDSYDDNLPF